MTHKPPTIATAPGKVILFGEHAINRGQPAIAAAIGLRACCHVTADVDGDIQLRSGQMALRTSRDEIYALVRRIDAARAAEDLAAIRSLARTNYFAAPLYVLVGV